MYQNKKNFSQKSDRKNNTVIKVVKSRVSPSNKPQASQADEAPGVVPPKISNATRNNLSQVGNQQREYKSPEEIALENIERVAAKEIYDARVVNDRKLSVSVSMRTSTKILLLEACRVFKTDNQSRLIERILLKYIINLLETKGVDWIEVLRKYDLYDPAIFKDYLDLKK